MEFFCPSECSRVTQSAIGLTAMSAIGLNAMSAGGLSAIGLNAIIWLSVQIAPCVKRRLWTSLHSVMHHIQVIIYK